MFNYPPGQSRVLVDEVARGLQIASILCLAVSFLIFVGVLYYFTRKSRRPKSIDLTWIVGATAISTLIQFALIDLFRREDFQFPFYLIPTWIGGAIAAVIALIRLWQFDGFVPVEESFGKLILYSFGSVFVVFLLVLIAPSVMVDRGTPMQTQCLNNMRNLGIAAHIYAEDHDGFFPAAAGYEPPRSWRVEILPYIEQQGLRDRWDDEVAWNMDTNVEYAKTSIEVYICPENPVETNSDGYPITAYAAVTGGQAFWKKDQTRNIDEISRADGLSQTLMIVEACGQNIAWAEPRDVNLDTLPVGINLPGSKKEWSDGLLSSPHRRGANVMFGDGSGRCLSPSMDPEVLKKLSTATGGDKLRHDEY